MKIIGQSFVREKYLLFGEFVVRTSNAVLPWSFCGVNFLQTIVSELQIVEELVEELAAPSELHQQQNKWSPIRDSCVVVRPISHPPSVSINHDVLVVSLRSAIKAQKYVSRPPLDLGDDMVVSSGFSFWVGSTSFCGPRRRCCERPRDNRLFLDVLVRWRIRREAVLSQHDSASAPRQP